MMNPMSTKSGETPIIIVPKDLIGAATAAEILGLERSTLTRWIQSNRIKPLAKLDGERGVYIFDRSEVVQLSQGLAA